MSYGSHYSGGSGGDSRYGDKSSYRGGSSSGYGGGSGGGYGGSGGGGGGGGSMGNLGQNLNKISWDLSKLPVFEKNFYLEHPAVSSRSPIVADKWRADVGITVVGHGIPKPCMTFEEASMPGRCSYP